MMPENGISGIGSHAACYWTPATPPGRHTPGLRISAKASTVHAEISRIGDLHVTTDDGDTVSISFSALHQLHTESVRGRAGGARIDYRNVQSTSQLAVSIGVEGSLDSEEIADIDKLLGRLAHPGEDATHALGDSLESFSYAYGEQVSVEYSASRVSALA